MSYLSRIVYVLIIMSFSVPIIVAIFNFFGVPFETYANYIFWMLALGIFYTIMPESRVSIFADNSR